MARERDFHDFDFHDIVRRRAVRAEEPAAATCVMHRLPRGGRPRIDPGTTE